MKHNLQPVYETRLPQSSSLQHKQVGSSEFRIHTWFDYERNTFVVDVLTSQDPLPVSAGKAARAR
jgi:hypothetical protein